MLARPGLPVQRVLLVQLRDRLVLRERAVQPVPQAPRVLLQQWRGRRDQRVVLVLPAPPVPPVFLARRVLPERLEGADRPVRQGQHQRWPALRVLPVQAGLADLPVPLEHPARAVPRAPQEPADQPDRPEPQVRWPDQRVRREHPVPPVRQAQEPPALRVRRALLAAAEHLAALLQL